MTVEQDFRNHLLMATESTLLSERTYVMAVDGTSNSEALARLSAIQARAMEIGRPAEAFSDWLIKCRDLWNAGKLGSWCLADLPIEQHCTARDDCRYEPKPLDIISAPELQKAKLPPVTYLVEGLLPSGTSLLTAASKIGKSWMVLDLGLCLASGRDFLGHDTNQCGVLYLALEDSLHRLQSRMNLVLGGQPAPDRFYFTTEAPKLDDGLLGTLGDHLRQHPDTKLIIVDTLQKIRGQALPREAAYAQDYREMEAVKSFADERGISVVFVHHNRKMRDDDDPFNMISGTNGIMGAADTIWTITKKNRADEEATLHIVGRDVDQSDTVITFDKRVWRWKALGAADALAELRARMEYDDSPIVLTIKKLLDQSPEHRWDGTAKDLMDAGKYMARTYLASDNQKLGYAIRDIEQALLDYDGIVHSTTKLSGSGGKKHHFYYQNLDQFEVLPEQTETPWQTYS